MALKAPLEQERPLLTVVVLLAYLVSQLCLHENVVKEFPYVIPELFSTSDPMF